MGDWEDTTQASPDKRIKEAEGVLSTQEARYFQDYVVRYSSPPSPISYDDAERNFREALVDCEPNTSLFVFGSGHSVHLNHYYKQGSFSKIVASDVVLEAGINLLPDIEFKIFNVLTDDFIENYDYIFSSHTIEHFTRDEIMKTILPKCLRAARKAVIFMVPWKDLGWGQARAEGPHIVELSEDDELAAQASKWKRVRDNPTIEHPNHYGLELILWFEGRADTK